MKKNIIALTAWFGLSISSAAFGVELMATVTSSKGTTRIYASSPADAYFFAPYVYLNKGGSGNYYNDLLLPAGIGSRQFTVQKGYCAAISTTADFAASKPRVYGPGSHSLSSFIASKGIQGMAVYASGGQPCNLSYDLPLLYSADGRAQRPVAPSAEPDGSLSQTFTNAFDGDLVGLLNDFIYSGETRNSSFNFVGASLTVPACNQVAVMSTNGPVLRFAGEYSGSSLALGNNWSYDFKLTSITPDCRKPSNIQRSAKGALIRHNGNNLCLNPEGGGVPTYDTRAVLTSNCSATDPGNKFRMLFDGTIQHVESGMCLHPRGGSSTPGNGTELVFWPSCGANTGTAGAYIRFENTLKDSLRQLSSGSCLHPNGGSATPANGTKVVFWQGCNEDRLRFTFELPN